MRATQHAVGRRIPDHLLLVAVPNQFPSQQHGEVGQVAERGGAVGDLDIDGGPQVALPDGLKPVGLVVHVEVLVFVRAIDLLPAGWHLKVLCFRIRRLVTAFPLEDEVTLLAPEDVAEFQFASELR